MNTRNCEELVKHVNDLYLSPLSAKSIDILEDEYGAIITRKHSATGFQYFISFKGRPFSAFVAKTPLSIGSSRDQFEIAVLKDGVLDYKTDITSNTIGYLEEEDLMGILRLIYKLDENGHLSKED